MAREGLRVLMINDHIEFGGGGDAVFQLEREAYEEVGHKVFTFSQGTDGGSAIQENDFVALESSSRLLQKVGKFLYHAGVARSLRAIVRKIQPDVVSVHLVSKYPLSIYPALQGHFCLQTLHGPNLFCTTAWGCTRNGASCELGIGLKCYKRGCAPVADTLLYMSLYRRLAGSVKRSVSLFVCPSKNIQASAESLGFMPTEFIPLGMDESFASAAPADQDGPPVVLFVGALVEQKGVHILLEAFKSVVSHISNAKLVIAGRGVMEAALRARAAALGISGSVEFLGFVKHAETVDLYRRAHVLAVPSIWREQFGLVGPEALACGVPCVGSDSGGIPEWLHDGEWGFIVPPRNPEVLARKLIALLENRELRLSFGAKGRAYARLQYGPRKYKENRLRLLGAVQETRSGGRLSGW